MEENKILEVNKLFENGMSMNQLEKDGTLGCSRKAFKNRAFKIGYTYDNSLKKFIKDDSIEIKAPTEHRVSKEKIIQKTTEEKHTIASLEARIRQLEHIVLSNNTYTAQPIQIELDTRTKGTVATRSIRVTKDAIELFNNIAETKLAMYTKQELMSQALIEFYEKYK